MLRRAVPFFGLGLCYTAEAVIDVARKALTCISEQKAPSDDTPIMDGLLIISDGVESPSASYAIWRELNEIGVRATFRVESARPSDPRRPRFPVKFQLWHFSRDEFVAMVDVPQPPPEIIVIAGRERYAADAWSYWAKDAARSLGEDAVRDLAAVMVHAPDKPARHQNMLW